MISKAIAHLCLVLVAMLLCPSTVHADEAGPLHLMFPHDFLSMSTTEKRLYVLGVVDARLYTMAYAGDPKLAAFTDCVEREGIDGILRVAEQTVVPQPGVSGAPMPWVIDRATQLACE